jgi:hypothetical protein
VRRGKGGTTKPRNETDNLKIYCDLRSFLQKKDLQAFQSRRKIKKEGFQRYLGDNLEFDP